MLLRIYFLILISVLSFAGTFASSDAIDVKVSHEHVELGDIFSLEITVNPQVISEQGAEIHVEGMDNFSLFSQGQSESYSDINGQIESHITFILQVEPLSEGNFTLGPVRLLSDGNELIHDEIYHISVGNIPEYSQGDDTLGFQKDTLGAIREISFPWWGKMAGVAVFFSLFYIILLLFMRHSESSVMEKTEENSPEEERNKKIIDILKKLKKNADNMEHGDFFRTYNVYLREILFRGGMKHALTATLKELKKSEDTKGNPYFKIYQKSYKYEFSKKEVSTETRKKYIDALIELLR